MDAAPDLAEEETFYDRIGGAPAFRRLIGEFFREVRKEPELADLYPQDDWDGAKSRLLMFLEQYWGGPTTYSQERGHPRLRMRHAPFPVDAAAHDAWLAHMRAALDEAAATFQLSPDDETELWDYLSRAAFAMVNTYPSPS